MSLKFKTATIHPVCKDTNRAAVRGQPLQTLTLLLLGAGGLLEVQLFLHIDRCYRLRLDPGRRLGPFGSGLGAGGRWRRRLLPGGCLGAGGRHQRGQRPAFRGGG